MQFIRAAIRPVLVLSLAAPIAIGQFSAHAQGKNLKIAKAKLTPKKMSYQGGNVSIQVKVTPAKKGVNVSSVKARPILGAQSSGALVGLQYNASSKSFTGTVKVPGNFRKQSTSVPIEVVATDNTGATTTANVGSVSVGAFAGDPNTPPPPPF